jgi:hypothetical protein
MTIILLFVLAISQSAAPEIEDIRHNLIADLQQLSKNNQIVPERLHKTEMLFKANEQLYTTGHDSKQANNYDRACFGCDNTSREDYEIWSKAFIQLSPLASRNNSLAALATKRVMVNSIKDIANNNAEWSELLEEAIPLFYFDNPRLTIDYLNTTDYEHEASQLRVLEDWDKQEEFLKKLKLIESNDPKRQLSAKRLILFLTRLSKP